MQKKRLDRLLVERGLAPTRQRAQALILSQMVLVDDMPGAKSGTLVREEAKIELKGADMPYVSRGGLKLEAALSHFKLDVTGLACLDVGASTGGFTDCLLSRGAAKVIAVDVGYGQLAWKLRQDARVTVVERTNIRFVDVGTLPFSADLTTIDVSFISLKLVIPRVLLLINPKARILALIKPQFEVGKGEVGKKGVVRDPEKHQQVLDDMARFGRDLGLSCQGPVASPILGPQGNREFFLLFSRK